MFKSVRRRRRSGISKWVMLSLNRVIFERLCRHQGAHLEAWSGIVEYITLFIHSYMYICSSHVMKVYDYFIYIKSFLSLNHCKEYTKYIFFITTKVWLMYQVAFIIRLKIFHTAFVNLFEVHLSSEYFLGSTLVKELCVLLNIIY